jgi:hypothetical protein
MTVILTIYYVLAANPLTVAEQRPLPAEPLTMAACLSGQAAQELAAAYVVAHPQWKLLRWSCALGRPADATERGA